MVCPNCGSPNEAGRKFCGECGTRLALACPQCGTASSATARFCGECGARLDAGSGAAGAVPAGSYPPAGPWTDGPAAAQPTAAAGPASVGTAPGPIAAASPAAASPAAASPAAASALPGASPGSPSGPRLALSAAAPTAPATERRLESVLFADLVGFTTLSADRDAEAVRELLTRYFVPLGPPGDPYVRAAAARPVERRTATRDEADVAARGGAPA